MTEKRAAASPMKFSNQVCAGKMWNDELQEFEPCTNLIPVLAVAHDDPYCSNVCAREAYGNPMPQSEYQKNRKYA